MPKFEHSLTTGSVARRLIAFSLPFLLSNFIQALYSVADMIIVSWFCGPESVAGVSNGGQVTLLVNNFVIGLTVGGTVLVGQYYGADRREDVRQTIGTTFSLLLIMSVVLTTLVIALNGPMLRLIQVPSESFIDARSYLNICMLGTPFLFGYNAVSAILRGMGDSQRPLIFVSIACALNALLDLLFVGTLGMGAAGAAIATVIAQGFALALSAALLSYGGFVFDFKPSSFRITKDKAALLLKIGMPTSIQNVVVNLSFLIMMALVNSQGVFASAAVGIVGKLNGFAILPAIAMSASVSSMAAQNIGASLPGRAREAMYTGIKIVLPVSAGFFTLAQIVPEVLMRIFTDSPDVIALGIQYMRFFAFDYLIVPFSFCFNGLLTGSGRTTFTMINGMMSSVLLRVPIALLLGVTLGLGLRGIALGAPVASVGAFIVSAAYIRTGAWKASRIKETKVAEEDDGGVDSAPMSAS